MYGFKTGAAAASFPLGGKYGDRSMKISEEWSQNSYKSHLWNTLPCLPSEFSVMWMYSFLLLYYKLPLTATLK